MIPCEHEKGCPHGEFCVDCSRWLPKDRKCFPWGSRKTKVCVTCIDKRFWAILKELDIDFAGIDEQVNGCI